MSSDHSCTIYYAVQEQPLDFIIIVSATCTFMQLCALYNVCDSIILSIIISNLVSDM